MSDPPTMASLHIKLAATSASIREVEPYIATHPEEAKFALRCLYWRHSGLIMQIENLVQSGWR